MLYNVCTWFKTYAFPSLNSIIISHRQRKGQSIICIEEEITAITADQQIENYITTSDLTTDVLDCRLEQIKKSIVNDFAPFISAANLDALNGIIEDLC